MTTKPDHSEIQLGTPNLNGPYTGNASRTYLTEQGDHLVPRGVWQDYITDAFASVGLSAYGYIEPEADNALGHLQLHDGTLGITTPRFTIRSYYWGEEKSLFHLPNFQSYEYDLKIFWYKYPLRDAYASRDITLDEFKEIVDAFVAEVKGLAPDAPDFR